MDSNGESTSTNFCLIKGSQFDVIFATAKVTFAANHERFKATEEES